MARSGSPVPIVTPGAIPACRPGRTGRRAGGRGVGGEQAGAEVAAEVGTRTVRIPVVAGPVRGRAVGRTLGPVRTAAGPVVVPIPRRAGVVRLTPTGRSVPVVPAIRVPAGGTAGPMLRPVGPIGIRTSITWAPVRTGPALLVPAPIGIGPAIAVIRPRATMVAATVVPRALVPTTVVPRPVVPAPVARRPIAPVVPPAFAPGAVLPGTVVMLTVPGASGTPVGLRPPIAVALTSGSVITPGPVVGAAPLFRPSIRTPVPVVPRTPVLRAAVERTATGGAGFPAVPGIERPTVRSAPRSAIVPTGLSRERTARPVVEAAIAGRAVPLRSAVVVGTTGSLPPRATAVGAVTPISGPVIAIGTGSPITSVIPVRGAVPPIRAGRPIAVRTPGRPAAAFAAVVPVLIAPSARGRTRFPGRRPAPVGAVVPAAQITGAVVSGAAAILPTVALRPPRAVGPVRTVGGGFVVGHARTADDAATRNEAAMIKPSTTSKSHVPDSAQGTDRWDPDTQKGRYLA